MSAPVMIRANYGDFFTSSALPALEEVFKHELRLHPTIREQLLKQVATDRDIWQASGMTDLQNFIQVDEGSDYTFVRPRQEANKTLVPTKYGLGFSISEEMVDDGKFDHIADSVRSLAESAIDTREIDGLNLFNNGFTTATAWDGLALFHTAHTLPSGLTFRNRLSTDADLSQASLDQMVSDFETQFISDSGKYRRIMPKVLLVHPSQRRYAMELIGSELKPDTADNNMNAMKQEGLRVLSSPRLTDTDAWFLCADPSQTGLRIVSRKGIETKAAGPDAGFMNDSILYKSRYREKVGITHAYGVFGTVGA